MNKTINNKETEIYKNFSRGLIASLIFIVLFFISGKSIFDNYSVYKATFNSVDGLSLGSKISLSGIKIGEIKSFELLDNGGTLVNMSIDKNLKFTADSQVSIRTSGLFGSKYLEVKNGFDEDYLSPNDYFNYTQASFSLTDILNMIISTAEKNKAAKGSTINEKK